MTHDPKPEAASLSGETATCRVCGKQFPHPAPGTGGTWTCSDACRLGSSYFPVMAATIPAGTSEPGALTLDGLRALGWAVAVHNDYRQDGEHFTFYLFTHPDGTWIKGEGRSDEEAIAAAAKDAHSIGHQEHLDEVIARARLEGHEAGRAEALAAVLAEIQTERDLWYPKPVIEAENAFDAVKERVDRLASTPPGGTRP